MATRLRTLGIGGSIAALLTSGALLFPAAQPAQAQRPSPGACQSIFTVIELAFAWGQWDYGWQMFERYLAIGCE